MIERIAGSSIVHNLSSASLRPSYPILGSPSVEGKDEKLRKAAAQLEGLFVQQLFKSMRETVPEGEGIISGGAGEDIFTSLMDEHVAADTPRQWERGMAEALYRQLRGVASTTASNQDQASPSSALSGADISAQDAKSVNSSAAI